MAEIGFGFPSNSEIPVGVVLPFFGTDTDVPKGWLLCDGRKFSVGRYATLAAQLSRAAGTYTDTTPDLRGRVPIGLDNMGGSSANRVTGAWADSLGGNSGAETHTLTTGEMPSHSHVEVGVDAATGVAGVLYSTAGGAQTSVGTGSTVSNMTNVVSTQATGSGGAHNNMQPSIAMNYIIKAE